MDKKRIAGFILLGVALLTAGVLLFCTTRSTRFSKLTGGEKDFMAVKESREELEEPPAEIYFNGEALFFDASSRTWYYSLRGDGESAMDPEVTVKGGASVMFRLGKITENMIRNNANQQMILYTDEGYIEGQLVCTTLPILNLDLYRTTEKELALLNREEAVSLGLLDAPAEGEEVSEKLTQEEKILVRDAAYAKYGEPEEGETLTFPITRSAEEGEISTEDLEMEMTLYDNRVGAAQRVTRSEGTMRVRGGSTQSYPKKGLKLNLTTDSVGGSTRPNDLSLLGMRQDNDWILYAAYNDQEKVRNVFSTALWTASCAKDNDANLDFGYEYQYVELFINGSYYGLYALGYFPDEKTIGLSGDAEKEALYKKIDWQHEDTIGFPGGYSNRSETVETDDVDDSDWSLLYEYYFAFSDAVEDDAALEELIDMDNSIDMMLFLNLIQGLDNVDGGIKNQYIVVRRNGDSVKGYYIPWDMDITWGNYWVDDASVNLTVSYGMDVSQSTDMKYSPIVQLVNNGSDEIWQAVCDKYAELRAGAWSDEAILAMLDGYEEDIFYSGAFLRDKARWKNGTYTEADTGLSDFKAYVLTRLACMDAIYARAEDSEDGAYVEDSKQYGDIREFDFIVEVGDYARLENEDVKGLFRVLGIDATKFTDGVHFAVGNASEGICEYYENIGTRRHGIKTAVGKIANSVDPTVSYEHSKGYTVKLNGYPLYNTWTDENVDFRVAIGTAHEGHELKADNRPEEKADFTCCPTLNGFRDWNLYAMAAERCRSTMVIRLSDTKMLRDEDFRASLTKLLGIEPDEEHDLYILDAGAGTCEALRLDVKDGTAHIDSDLGDIDYSETAGGGFNLSLRGKQILGGSLKADFSTSDERKERTALAKAAKEEGTELPEEEPWVVAYVAVTGDANNDTVSFGWHLEEAGDGTVTLTHPRSMRN